MFTKLSRFRNWLCTQLLSVSLTCLNVLIVCQQCRRTIKCTPLLLHNMRTSVPSMSTCNAIFTLIYDNERSENKHNYVYETTNSKTDEIHFYLTFVSVWILCLVLCRMHVWIPTRRRASTARHSHSLSLSLRRFNGMHVQSREWWGRWRRQWPWNNLDIRE